MYKEKSNIKKLVPITNSIVGQEEIKTINARSIWKFVESKREFSHWITQRIEKFGFIDGEDFTTNLSKNSGIAGLGRPSKEYHVSLDMGKELGMVENNDKGRQVRRYFIEAEKKASVSVESLTRLDIARMLVDSEEGRIAAVEKLDVATDRLDLLTHVDKTYTTSEIAKELGFVSAQKLNEKLTDDKIIYKRNKTWLLYSEYAGKGYDSEKQSEHRYKNGNKFVIYGLHWTQKGREFLLHWHAAKKKRLFPELSVAK